MCIRDSGTGNGQSVLDMVKAFGKACGKEIPYVIKPRRAGDIDVYKRQAVINVALDVVFIVVFGMGVEGCATTLHTFRDSRVLDNVPSVLQKFLLRLVREEPHPA